MTRPPLFRLSSLLVVLACCHFQLHAASWPQIAQNHSRCNARFERARQLLETFESGVDRLQAMRGETSGQQADELGQVVNATLAKVDYLRNRFERVRSMSQKLEQDIETKRRESSSCPDCIASSVDLFCRQAETLADELGAQIQRVRELEREIARQAGQQSAGQEAKSPLETKLLDIRSAVEKNGDERARALIAKALEHFELSIELSQQGKEQQAGKEARIAENLADRALELTQTATGSATK